MAALARPTTSQQFDWREARSAALRANGPALSSGHSASALATERLIPLSQHAGLTGRRVRFTEIEGAVTALAERLSFAIGIRVRARQLTDKGA